jgi:DNA-binding CsgD family transcriptional regulator
MTLGLTIALTWQGRLAEAAERAEEASEVARLSGSDPLMAWALALRSWVALKRGDLDAALAEGEESVRRGGALAVNPYAVVAGCWLAEARIEAGDEARGREELLAAAGGEELPGVEPAFRSYFYEVLVQAELALGRPRPAADWARRAEAAAQGLGLGGRVSFALRARAAVELAEGDAAGAAELALEAAAAAERSGHPLEGARARVLAGRALAPAGDRAAAVAELEAARDALAACGAERYRDQAVRELRRLGEHVARPGRRGRAEAGPDSLSGRELEVAQLVRERLTNREIAERLFLSEKTVERHLSRIFRKLGARSRVEVARELESAEQGDPAGV